MWAQLRKKLTNMVKDKMQFTRTIFSAFFLTAMMLTMTAEAQQEPPSGGFTIARLKYGGGGDWYGNQSSLNNLLEYAGQVTDIDIKPEEVRVELTDDALFAHPYIFMTGHGNVRFTQNEVERLRIYLTGGGFLHADDNYGMDKHLRREMKKVFPDKEWVELPFNHELYNVHFDFPNGLPKIHEHDGGPGRGYALFHEGRMVVFYSVNTDLSDGWEDPDVHNVPPEDRDAALKMGVNIIVYVLTR